MSVYLPLIGDKEDLFIRDEAFAETVDWLQYEAVTMGETGHHPIMGQLERTAEILLNLLVVPRRTGPLDAGRRADHSGLAANIGYPESSPRSKSSSYSVMTISTSVPIASEL